VDGTASSGVTQVTKIEAVNTNKLNVGGVTPLVGIGLAAGDIPSAPLEVVGNVRANVSNAGGFFVTGDTGIVRNSATGVALRTGTGGGTDRLIVDTAGNVGIGGSPSYKLDCFGDVKMGNRASNAQVYITSTANSSFLHFETGGGGEGGTLRSDSYLKFDTGGANTRLTIASTGLATFSNGIAVTTGGVKFPATQSASADANTLDDYEEGTWTPTQGTFGTWTSPVFTATYVKIGKLVQVSCYQTSGTIDPGGTQKTIGGFPFAVASRASCSLINDGPSLAANGLIYPGSIMYVYQDIGSQTSFVFSAVYLTA